MKSIRLSLILYFLVLLVLALGAVLGLLYQTTSQTLAEKDRNAFKFLEAENENRCNALIEDFNTKLLLRAQELASLAQSQWGQSNHQARYTATVHASGYMPGGLFLTAMWAAQGPEGQIASRLSKKPFIKIQIADDVVPEEAGDEQTDYFQFYNEEGYTVQKSRSLDQQAFTLDPNDRNHLQLYHHQFDDTELNPGSRV